MDLNHKTTDHLKYMIEAIIAKLKMASAAAMRPEAFSLDSYDDVRDIYELVMSKDRFSINEMEAIVSELGQLRNRA
jgi:uncharacterized protein YfkK (UPF0435 family)